MKCPKCGAEYKDGFTKCSDCDVELVEGSPQQPQHSTWWQRVVILLVLLALIPFGVWFSFSEEKQRSIRSRIAIVRGSAEEVTFADPETEEYVRRALRIPKGTAEHPVPVTDRDLERLTRLRICADDLPLVKHCRNLTRLVCHKGVADDLLPLAGLLELKHLDLQQYGEGVSLTPLSTLTNLTSLSLHRYLSSPSPEGLDMSWLEGLVKLEHLNLSHSGLADISSLATLVNLKSLNLSDNRIADISALEHLPELAHDGLLGYRRARDNKAQSVRLKLSRNLITDISPLVRNAGLDATGVAGGIGIDLTDNPLNDGAERYVATLESRGVHVWHGISRSAARECIRTGRDIPAFTAKGITLLRLAADESSIVSNLSTIGRMVNVTSLSMRVSADCDLRPLASLTNLTALWINQSEIQDLTPLAQLPALAQLGLVGTEVSDIESVSSLTNLAALALDCANINDVQHLASPSKLTHLEIFCGSLGSPHVIDLRPLASLNSLTNLEVRCTALHDLGPLGGLSALSTLHIRQSRVSDVSPLRSLTQLRDLRIGRSQIRDISPLAGCVQLRSLWLGPSAIRDLAPLSGLQQLRFLILNNNQIEDISALAQLPRLGHDLGHDPDSELHFIDGQRLPICLGLSDNRISDISPLVDNGELGTSHGIDLRGNPLNEEAYSTHIPALQERGVQVYFDPPRGTK